MKSIAIAIAQLCAVTECPDACEWFMFECLNIERAECRHCLDDVLTEICIETYDDDVMPHVKTERLHIHAGSSLTSSSR